MKIKDLKPKQRDVDIIVDVIDIGAPREFQKFGKPGKVATAIAKDDTGDIKLTLWNDDIEIVKAGDKIHLTNGYVSEWQGEMQLTTGRTTGRKSNLEVVGKADASSKKEDNTIYTNAPMRDEENSKFNIEEEEIDDTENSDDEEI